MKLFLYMKRVKLHWVLFLPYERTVKQTDGSSNSIKNTYFKQIQNLHAKLIVKIAICGISHIIDENEPVSLCLNTGGEKDDLDENAELLTI